MKSTVKRILAFSLSVLLTVSCFGITAMAERTLESEEKAAAVLKELGLFKGVSDTDFDLDRAPTRVEAIIILIRVLGKESEALSADLEHPFTDVPEWADKYIGYAYQNGLTNGQSATEFGVGNASDAMFTTFVLRSLGYSDTDGKDFVWNDPFTLARRIGVVTDSVVLGEGFLRADVVTVSTNALSAYIKDSDITLAEKLIEAGAFTSDMYLEHFTLPEKPKKELSAEEIYEKCAPAVFFIEICDANGNPIASGSGFFIDNKGTAVTNYHVIRDAYSAYAQLSSGNEKYAINGYYDYNEAQDWAVLKVDCENESFLETGKPETVVGAATVYAIGSPLGLQNTITQGIISNAARKDEESGVTYIQTSAAISSGSSGGALINKYGDVIGITSAGYNRGQNLNLALPISVIEGYASDEVHRFNPLGFTDTSTKTEDPYERQQLAFEVLKTFTLSYGQSTNSEGFKEYRMTQYGTNMQLDCYLYYNGSTDRIIGKIVVTNPEDEMTNSVTAQFRNDEFTTEIDYRYVQKKPFEHEANGHGFLKNAEFETVHNHTFKFDYYDGNTANMITHHDLAMDLHATLLIFISQIFDQAMSEHGSYSIKDLGYTSFAEK